MSMHFYVDAVYDIYVLSTSMCFYESMLMLFMISMLMLFVLSTSIGRWEYCYVALHNNCMIPITFNRLGSGE
jgi:hypothetical protein